MHAMAKTISSSQCSIIATALLLIILSSSLSLESIETNNNNNDEHDDHEYVKSPKELGLINQEKLSHFHFYWHDIVSGRNPTSVVVIPPLSNTSASLFGMLVMIDDPLTEGPGLRSRLVGKAQGIYAAVGQQEQGLLMAMNFVFLGGKYNGSGITVMGRNSVLSEVREMPVIGGTGLLRFSRGYVRARTHKFNPKTGDAIVDYNAYVLHY